MGRRVRKFDGPSGRGLWLSPLRAMSIKSALRIHLSVSYGMIGILVISHLRWLFPPPFGGASHQRGIAFSRPQGGCMVFAAKGGIKNGAKGAVPPQWNGTSYLPRARALNPPVRRSQSQAEPLAPRAKGPAAPSTLTPIRACQPSGIQLSADSSPKPMVSLTPKAAYKTPL